MSELKTIGSSMEPVMEIIINAKRWFEGYVEFQQQLINNEKDWNGDTARGLAKSTIRAYASTKIKPTELKILALFGLEK